MSPEAAPTPSAAEAHVVRMRSVVALIAVWVVWGLWFHINYPGGFPAVSLLSVVVGIPATVFGLLPPAEQKGWRTGATAWVQKTLARPRVATSFALFAAASLLVGTLCSSVRVETTHGTPAVVEMVEGSQSAPDGVALWNTMTVRVGRERGMDVALRPVWLGAQWAHTRSQVSQSAQHARPWRPARWAYPDDFDEIVTLFILPMAQTSSAFLTGPMRVVVLGAAGDTIVDTMVNLHGKRVQYLGHSFEKDSLRASWTRTYQTRLTPPWAILADSLALADEGASVDSVVSRRQLERRQARLGELTSVPSTVELWIDAHRVYGNRPLHRGETVRFNFVDESGPVTVPVEVVLDRNPYPLLIEASHVNRAQPIPPS